MHVQPDKPTWHLKNWPTDAAVRVAFGVRMRDDGGVRQCLFETKLLGPLLIDEAEIVLQQLPEIFSSQ